MVHAVIASAAKQSSVVMAKAGLLRRCAPRNDGGGCLAAQTSPRHTRFKPQCKREEMPRILMTGAAGGIGTSLRKLLPPIYPDLLLSDLKAPADLGKDEKFK